MATPRLALAKLRGFPADASDKIETIVFIEASNEVIGIIESFGKLFSPVVTDMKGNVNNLLEHYQKDAESRKYIFDMILSDEQMATHPWLLWLGRALELIERFFHHILSSDVIMKEQSDDLRPMISKAYDEVLKPYHGFLLQNTFKVCIRFLHLNIYCKRKIHHSLFPFQLLNRWMPSRKTLLGSDAYFDENIIHLRILMPRMKNHLDMLKAFYAENNLNDTRKV